MKKYSIIIDPDFIENEIRISPYNLRKDLKDISIEAYREIGSNILNELILGPGRPSNSICYRCKNNICIYYSKIRIKDLERNKGKSGGYRIISLVDEEDLFCFVLHIYRHAHGEDNDISKNDKNKLERIVEEYYKSKMKYLQKGKK